MTTPSARRSKNLTKQELNVEEGQISLILKDIDNSINKLEDLTNSITGAITSPKVSLNTGELVDATGLNLAYFLGAINERLQTVNVDLEDNLEILSDQLKGIKLK